MPKVFI